MLFKFVFGFNRGHGESVCAPMITKPFPGLCFLPTANAHTALMFRVKKYLPPGERSEVQESTSRISCWFAEGIVFLPFRSSFEIEMGMGWKSVRQVEISVRVVCPCAAG